MNFTESPHCIDPVSRKPHGAHCAACRISAKWRASTGAPDVCPFGITLDNLPAPRPPGGPGTELKAILSAMGIAPGNCTCNAMASKMDAWGPDGCEQHMEEIVGSLTTAAEQRGWMRIIPFKELGARGLALLAISRNKLNQAI